MRFCGKYYIKPNEKRLKPEKKRLKSYEKHLKPEKKHLKPNEKHLDFGTGRNQVWKKLFPVSMCFLFRFFCNFVTNYIPLLFNTLTKTKPVTKPNLFCNTPILARSNAKCYKMLQNLKQVCNICNSFL